MTTQAAAALYMRNHRERSSKQPTGTDFRDLREAHGLNQHNAGRLIYVSRDAVAKWESGERRIHPAFFELFRLKLSLQNQLKEGNK